jgi:nanoRNase/pAp phosphatase (c-di-AMP/oligoRNAs hydrolase)
LPGNGGISETETTVRSIPQRATDLLKAIAAARNVLAVIKGSPDPDAIAAAYTFRQIAEKAGGRVVVESEQQPSLPQNRRIIADLHLPIHYEAVGDSVRFFDAYAVFDHQSIQVDGVTGVIPCLVHIDHHQAVDHPLPARFRWICEEAGSTSTLIALLLEHLVTRQDWSSAEEQKACTALYFGMHTDTDAFSHLTELDQRALNFLRPRADIAFINHLASLPFPRPALRYLERAIQNQEIYRDWLITGMGFVDSRHRDAIALIADFLLRRHEVNMVVAFALIRQDDQLRLDAALRSPDKEFDLDRLIKRFSPAGGGRAFKGAFQVDLSYFSDTPHPILLWHLVRLSTTAKIRYQRDQLDVQPL